MGDHGGELTCPECGAGITMGLPRTARVAAVTATPESDFEDYDEEQPRRKHRRTACDEGHTCHVYFEY